MAQRRGLGIHRMSLLADIGVAQDVHPFGIGGHDSVFHSVVNHLHEMAGAVGAAMQVAILGGAVLDFFATRGALDGLVIAARGERRENRIEMLHYAILAADHLTVAALEPEDAAAGPRINIVDSFRL